MPHPTVTPVWPVKELVDWPHGKQTGDTKNIQNKFNTIIDFIFLFKLLLYFFDQSAQIPVRVYVMGFFNLIKAISPEAPGEEAHVDVNTIWMKKI